jgi:hypothetical protein
VRETFDEVALQREDGWLVLFRDNDAILCVREEHVQSMESATSRRDRHLHASLKTAACSVRDAPPGEV